MTNKESNRWTDVETTILHNLVRKGFCNKAIATVLGRTKEAVVQKLKYDRQIALV